MKECNLQTKMQALGEIFVYCSTLLGKQTLNFIIGLQKKVKSL